MATKVCLLRPNTLSFVDDVQRESVKFCLPQQQQVYLSRSARP